MCLPIWNIRMDYEKEIVILGPKRRLPFATDPKYRFYFLFFKYMQIIVIIVAPD